MFGWRVVSILHLWRVRTPLCVLKLRWKSTCPPNCCRVSGKGLAAPFAIRDTVNSRCRSTFRGRTFALCDALHNDAVLAHFHGCAVEPGDEDGAVHAVTETLDVVGRTVTFVPSVSGNTCCVCNAPLSALVLWLA